MPHSHSVPSAREQLRLQRREETSDFGNCISGYKDKTPTIFIFLPFKLGFRLLSLLQASVISLHSSYYICRIPAFASVQL
ncbi:hypothetical protein L2E82_32581 [Cichorium intybus]|uniref:Uncharacterized protein n=1 Tax=Cichorium intybus TaxID=13427 RepID=A0ACB9BH78_CICIN|nr:hypothetical protein L2E82_32581 [Cichorium intybus]